MAQVGLQCPRIVALVGQREAAGMPQHMRMSLEAQPGSDAGALDKPCEAGSAEGRTTLGCEDERRLRFLLTLQPARYPQLVAENWMHCRRAGFGPADGQGGPIESI